MNKRPGLRKRLALELFRSIRKNRAKIHELRTLFWECTLRCNASCLHCGSDCHVSSAHPDMPVEDFLKVIDEITPHVDPHQVMITFTGGEALIRKDIEVCGRELNKREYPWGIVSNGLLLTRERLDSLLAAGMHSITISLDGFEEAHNWLRGNRRSFERGRQCHCDAGGREGYRLGRRDLRQPKKFQRPDAVQRFLGRNGSQKLAYLYHFSGRSGSRDTGVADRQPAVHLAAALHPPLPRRRKDTHELCL